MSTMEGCEEVGEGRVGRRRDGGEGDAAGVAETQREMEGESSLEVSVPSEFEISSSEVEKLLEQQGSSKLNFLHIN